MRILVIAFIVVMSGCASGVAIQAANVKVAEPSQVANCRYLDSVMGTSSW